MLLTWTGWVLAAAAGDLDGQVTIDGLHARTVSAEAGAGPDEVLASTDLGFRVRLELRELDDRLRLSVDYRDREPVGGRFSNSAVRLLYAGELRYEAVDDRLTIGAGRFLAPAAVLTPVDGLRAQVQADRWSFEAYGGRRGFSQSRQNLPLNSFLPAFGGVVRRTTDQVQLVALGGWSQDRLVLLPASPVERDVGAAHALVTAVVRPVEPLRVGGQAAFTQQASYFIGPTWSDLEVRAEALDLWRGLVWADWRPSEHVGLLADLHHQEVGAYSAGSVDGAGDEELLVEPRFTDARLEGDVSLWARGWVRPMARYRIRHDRQELRAGGQIDVDDLGVDGPFASGRLYYDAVSGDQPDRVMWAASAGWDRGALECELGASFVERAASPFGSRRGNGQAGEDLNPFVLQAQQVAFVRGFWSGERLFAGIDLEHSLQDAEYRVFVQLGALGAVQW